MKKIALILLISIYALSSFGIGIQQFYCCGKLKSTSISFVQDTKEKCSKENGMSGCCKTKYQSFKVKDTHIAAHAISNPVKYFSAAIIFNSSFENTALAQQQPVVINPSHAPPLHNGLPIYILHCVYRI